MNWSDPSSKELYIANGGNKLYIYKDGFADVYHATPEEEAEWAKEVVASSLQRVETQQDLTALKFAIGNLKFHHYDGLESYLISKLNNTTASRAIAFANELWIICKYEQSFQILLDNLEYRRHECITTCFGL